MFIIIGFYLVALLIIIGVSIGVFKLFDKRSRLLASMLALITLSTSILLWPVPIHGGFMFLGEELYNEIEKMLERRQHEATQQYHREITARIHSRFAQNLDYTTVNDISDKWARVNAGIQDDPVQAYYHQESGLLFSEWLILQSSNGLPTLYEAKSRCEDHAPAGGWTLASGVENYYLWKGEGNMQLPRAPTSSVSLIIIEGAPPIEMPAYAMRHSGSKQGVNPGNQDFVVRCVALTANAPAGGYKQSEISLDEWNRYQLSKVK
ncbi:MAG: hypothetical protein OQL16_06675 [Gammaproteobacteria bacterium]|nr:hypothetical protein [Gammaproteobacteria bacterium]